MNEDSNLIFSLDSIGAAANAFSEDNLFQVIDMKLSNYDLDILNSFKIDLVGREDFRADYWGFNNFNLFNPQRDLKSFLSLLSPSNNQTAIDHVSDLIMSAITSIDFSSDKDTHAIELSVRATNVYDDKSLRDLDIISWHTDPKSLECESAAFLKKEDYTFSWALKGPSTLHYLPSQELDKEITDKFGYETGSKEMHDALAEKLNSINEGRLPKSNVYSVPTGYATIFLDGAIDGAIHSSPAYKDERLMMLVSHVKIPNNPFFKSPTTAEHEINNPNRNYEIFYMNSDRV